MLRDSAEQKRRETVFLIVLLMAFLSGILKPIRAHLYDIPALLYCGLIIAWSLSIRRRVVQRSVRRLLTFASVLMVVLFCLRICRGSLLFGLPGLQRYAWYAYYIPLCLIPMTGFRAALRVSRDETGRPLPFSRTLWVAGAALSLLFLTNDLHGLAFRFAGGNSNAYDYGPAYYLLVVWALVMSLATLILLLRCCRISAVRRLWYVPAGVMAVGIVLLSAYFVCGGSPTISGVKLYQLHEAVCFLFIGTFESCIRIGLLPVNSGYELLFDHSHINAVIRSDEGRDIFVSQSYTPVTEADGFRMQSAPIRGGSVSWADDLRDAAALNERLESVTQELEDENGLIREENAIRAERISYETKNRLYDRIAEALRPQAERMQTLFSGAGEDEGIFRQKLLQAAVLGAYIKRRGNLILNAEEHPRLSSSELGLAIRESFEYLALSDKTVELREEGGAMLPAALVLLAYELFETVLEGSYDKAAAFDVLLRRESGDVPHFSFTMAFDHPKIPVAADWQRDRLAALGAKLACMVRDETAFVMLTAEAGEGDDL